MELSPVFPLREESYHSPSSSARSETKSDFDQPPLKVNEVLKGVVAYVEVRSHAENRSQAISLELQELGAVVSNRLNASVTHVIYREGRKRTKDWAERHSVPLVSVGWILACKKALRKISESTYLVIQPDSGSDEASPFAGLPGRRRLRSMQPKDLDEDLKLSAERKKRAARRNAKRIDLHRRAVEAENCLKTFETEITSNYYANPRIRVPLTPPSMKEYTERMGQRRTSSDSESTASRRSSININTDFPLPRRRLFHTPYSTCQAGHDQIDSTSPFLTRRDLCKFPTHNNSTVLNGSMTKSHRKLFNAAAFEAAGVLIEPQHSSNRLQDISKVFPKSFRKRKIVPHKPEKKKTITIFESEESDESTNHLQELDFPKITKSRRLSAQKSGVDSRTCDTFPLSNSISPDSPCTSSIVDKSQCKSSTCEQAHVKTSIVAGDHNLPQVDSDVIVIKGQKGEDDRVDEGVDGAEEDDTLLDLAEPPNGENNDIVLKRKSDDTEKPQHDILEMIDYRTKFREFMKKPPLDISIAVRRKSVRFSDELDEDLETDVNINSPVFETSIESESKVTEEPPNTLKKSQRKRVVKRKRMSTGIKPRRRSNGLHSSEVATLISEQEVSDNDDVNESSQESHKQASGIGISSESEETPVPITPKTPVPITNSLSSATPGSPKKRRSTRLSGFLSSVPRQGNTVLGRGSTSSTKRRPNVRRSCPAKGTPVKSTSSDLSSESSGLRSRQRLRYSYELSTPEQEEKAYGVLVLPQPDRRTSKRLSFASVLKAVTSSQDSPSNDSLSKSQSKFMSRQSMDDFKQSDSCSESSLSQSQQSTIRGKRRMKELENSGSSKDLMMRRFVFTSLHKNEQDAAKKAISSLGRGRVYNYVTSTTTHVVTTWPVRRTLNLLRAALYGCHVVTLSWLIESREAGRWLPEDNYRIKEVPAAENNPSIRRIFESFKGIFVDNGVSPPQKELKTLIELAGGKVDQSIAASPQNASIIVSSQSGDSTTVSPKWILDSIMESEALPFEEYQLN